MRKLLKHTDGAHTATHRQDSKPRIDRVSEIKFKLFFWIFGRILVLDVFHWIRLAETSVAVSAVSEFIFWNLAKQQMTKCPEQNRVKGNDQQLP